MRCAVWAAVIWLAVAAAAGADVLRPLDERATARLIADEVARQAPGTVVDLATTRAWITLRLPDGGDKRVVLDKLHKALREADDASAREVILRDFVGNALEAAPVVPVVAAENLFPLDAALVMPILRPESWRDVLDWWPENTGGFASTPFPGDLMQCWTTYTTGALANCHHGAGLNAVGLDIQKISVLALINLRARLAEVVETVNGRFHRATLDTTLGPSLMLLPEYWNGKAKGRLVTAAIPTTEAVIWIADASDEDLAWLRQRAIAEHAAAKIETVCLRRAAGCSDWPVWGQVDTAEPLSPALYRWTGSGWNVLPE